VTAKIENYFIYATIDKTCTVDLTVKLEYYLAGVYVSYLNVVIAAGETVSDMQEIIDDFDAVYVAAVNGYYQQPVLAGGVNWYWA